MQALERIQTLYNNYGNKQYGEKISQLQHAIQCAKLAEQNHASDSLIAASLLHDIGHLLYNDEIATLNLNDRHETLGAQLLQNLFGSEVAQPVKLHVLAKRYLCSINQGYYEGLSEASKESLALQGGVLESASQKAAFEKHPCFEQALDLRHWDDEGKNEQDNDVDFSRYMPLLESLHQRA